MVKVKHFETKSFRSLETEINKFLSFINEKDFISIKYLYSNLACVVYKENIDDENDTEDYLEEVEDCEMDENDEINAQQQMQVHENLTKTLF
jgi:hypothetical protein